MTKKKLALEVNSRIKTLLQSNQINIQDGLTFLISVYYNLTPSFIPKDLENKVLALNIINKDYETNQIVWKVNLFEEQITGFEWITEFMDLFGKAPFYDENSAINSQGPEYDRQALFTFIENELNAVLPNLKAPKTNEYGRVDQGVANMILAKMYLNAQVFIGAPKYSECVTQCNAIIAGGYALNENYMNNFKAGKCAQKDY